MPKKGKKKARNDQGASSGAGVEFEEEADAMSTASQCGSVSSEQSLDPFGESGSADDGVDIVAQADLIEDKIKEAIDALSEKSAKVRLTNLLLLTKMFQKQLVGDFLLGRYVTLADAVEKCVKKGKGEEQAAAVKLIPLLCVQLGLVDESETIFNELKPHLSNLLADNTASVKARAGCAEALSLCGFLASHDVEVCSRIMAELEVIFSKSYYKGDKTPPVHPPPICALHNAALQGYSLLLSISPESIVQQHIDRYLPRVPELLDSNDVELKITAGETLALFYELAREQHDNFRGPNTPKLMEKLQQLSTENSKHQAKKDRKAMRTSFREILSAIQSTHGDPPNFDCKFGREMISIDTWARKQHYDRLCDLLASGVNHHLKENDLIRQVFDLGSPIPDGTPVAKISKNDRRLYHQHIFRARTQARNKQRAIRTHQLGGS